MDRPDRSIAPSLQPLARELADPSACRRSRTTCVGRARGCRSLGFRSFSRRSTCTSAARCSCCSPRTRTRVTRPRRRPGTSARSGSRSFRAAVSAGTRGSSRRLTSSASAHARSTCSGRRGRLRLRGRARRGVAAAGGATGAARPRRRRRAGDRRPRRAPGARGLRARRAGRGAWAVRGPRRDRRRLPDHRPRPAACRAVRRRDRGDPRLLAVHAARAPSS